MTLDCPEELQLDLPVACIMLKRKPFLIRARHLVCVLMDFPDVVDLALIQSRHAETTKGRGNRPSHLWLCKQDAHPANMLLEYFGISCLFHAGTLLGRVDNFGAKESFEFCIWV